MVDVVDDLVAGVVGNPASVQSSPSSFFNCTWSSISSAMTSFFLTSLASSCSTSFAWPPLRDGGRPAGRLQSTLGLVKHLLDPEMDLAGLKAELVGQVGDGLFAATMPSDDLSLLLRGEMPRDCVMEFSSDRVYANPTGATFQFQVRQDRWPSAAGQLR